MSARDLAVLDTSSVAREVAMRLTLPVHKKGDDEDEPVIIVVSQEKDLEILEWAMGIRKVVGLVAWELPETILARVLEIDIPVMIGHVGQDQISSLKKWGGEAVSNDVEREKASRLAHIESLFHGDEIHEVADDIAS